MSNGHHSSSIDVLADAAKETSALHLASIVNEDFSDLDSVEASQVERGKIRRDVHDLPRHVGVAADAAGVGGSVDVARGWRARGHRKLCRAARLLAASAEH
jgi:hypothetical protein